MIAFGCAVTAPENYRHWAEPGLLAAAEPDSPVLANAAAGSMARSLNLLLDGAAGLNGLEALVIVHQDAQIADPRLAAKVRSVLDDPEVAVAGCVGAVGAPTIAWWEGAATWKAFARCYRDYGGGPLPGRVPGERALLRETPEGEVDTLDGFLMVLSPWTVQTLRFDEGLDMFLGHDFDLCCQVKAAGRKVVVADFDVHYAQPLELVTSSEAWQEAHMTVSEKWDGHLPFPVDPRPEDWRDRARLAEAEAGAAALARSSRELVAYSGAGRRDAAWQELASTASWRVTEPLRRMNASRRARR